MRFDSPKFWRDDSDQNLPDALMRIIAMLLAEYASISQDNKLTVAGVWDALRFQRHTDVPPADGPVLEVVPVPPVYFVAQIDFSIANGLRHTAALYVRDADGRNVVGPLNMPDLQLRMNKHGRPMRHTIVVALRGLMLPGPGDYAVELHIDANLVGDTPLYVSDETPNGKP